MFLELGIKDFCCFGDITLPLERQGLVWVGGENLDTAAADSNGSGKTTLFKALTWVIFGKTIDGEQGDKVIRHGAKRALVSVSLERGWLVERERRKGSTRLVLSSHGIPVAGSRKEVQARILELVGLDFQAFKNTVLYGQNDSARFADPRVKDSERKGMLHCIQRTSVLKDCHRIALDRSREAHVEINRLETLANGALAAKNISKRNMEADKASALAWEHQRRQRYDAAREQALEFKERAMRMLREVPDVVALQEDIQALEIDIAAAEAAKEAADAYSKRYKEALGATSEARGVRGEAAAKLSHCEEHLRRLEGSECPICGEDLTSGSGKVAAKDAELAVGVAREALARAQQSEGDAKAFAETASRFWTSEDAKAGQADRLRTERFETHKRLQAAHNVAERAGEVAERARESLTRAKRFKAESNPHGESVERHRSEARAHRDEERRIKSEIKAKRESLAAIEFWVRGFGGQGLPSFILDSAMPYITERANHYLEILSDGDISMEFNTQRELSSAKGEFRDEISIGWTIEGVEGYPPSGGQQRKMEIATDLALMDLTETQEGSALDLFIADEILDGLDGEGTSRVLKLLHELRGRRGSVFIISHQPAMGEIFEKSITVSKDCGVARLKVA